jgi:hypothetical protein
MLLSSTQEYLRGSPWSSEAAHNRVLMSQQAGRTHSQAAQRDATRSTCNPPTHARARTHARTHKRTHARTHTHKGAHTEERRATNSSAVASKVGRGLAVTVNRLVHQLLLPALSVHPCQPFHLIRISLPSLVKDTAPPIPFAHSPGSPGGARMRLASQPAAHTGAQTNSRGERRAAEVTAASGERRVTAVPAGACGAVGARPCGLAAGHRPHRA